MRKGKTFAAELYMVGHLASNGRIRRIDQISRQLEEGQ